MKAFKLKSGAIVFPRRVSGPGIIGDGLALALEGDEEWQQWLPFTVKAPPEIERLGAKLMEIRKNHKPGNK